MLLVIELSLYCQMCDLHCKFEDRTKTAVAIGDDRYVGQTHTQRDRHTLKWFYTCTMPCIALDRQKSDDHKNSENPTVREGSPLCWVPSVCGGMTVKNVRVGLEWAYHQSVVEWLWKMWEWAWNGRSWWKCPPLRLTSETYWLYKICFFRISYTQRCFRFWFTRF